MTRRFLPFLLLIALAGAGAGCAARQSTVTNLPTGVTQAQVQSWDSAVGNLHAVAIANSNLRQAVIALHAQTTPNGAPLVSDDVYSRIIIAIGKIDQAENAASGVLSQTPNNWNQSVKGQVAAYTAQIAAALQVLNGEGIAAAKGSSREQQIGQFIGNIAAAIQIIAALA